MLDLTIQYISKEKFIPQRAEIKKYVKAALADRLANAELTIRIVDAAEIQTLNNHYRHKNKPTNVLSFPAENLLQSAVQLLGDIVICASIVHQEAEEQHKTFAAHWAHMIIHGILHLLGFDHEENAAAEIMEAEEIKILNKLGFNNPYQEK